MLAVAFSPGVPRTAGDLGGQMDLEALFPSDQADRGDQRWLLQWYLGLVRAHIHRRLQLRQPLQSLGRGSVQARSQPVVLVQVGQPQIQDTDLEQEPVQQREAGPGRVITQGLGRVDGVQVHVPQGHQPAIRRQGKQPLARIVPQFLHVEQQASGRSDP